MRYINVSFKYKVSIFNDISASAKISISVIILSILFTPKLLISTCIFNIILEFIDKLIKIILNRMNKED